MRVTSLMSARRVAASLPAPVKVAVQRAAGVIDPLVVRRYRQRTGYAGPLPPLHIRARAGGQNIDVFVRSGESTADALEEFVLASGRELDAFGDVLDLACGSGRTLVPLARRHPGVRFSGCDVDRPAIEWLAAHRPELDVRANAFEPPLPWPDDSFDLVLSFSLFTHLNEASQFTWLREVRRVLRPEGLGVLTVHLPRTFGRFASGAIVGALPPGAIAARAPLEPDGFIYLPVQKTLWNPLRFIDGEGFGLTFHGPEYIERRWREIFSSVELVKGVHAHQDAVLVRP